MMTDEDNNDFVVVANSRREDEKTRRREDEKTRRREGEKTRRPEGQKARRREGRPRGNNFKTAPSLLKKPYE